jgi:hypothetical protein
LLIVQITAALAADVFVTDDASLAAAIAAAPAASSAAAGDHVIWLVPGVYQRQQYDVDDKALTLMGLVPDGAILRGIDGGAEPLLRLRGDTEFAVVDVVLDGQNDEIVAVENNATGVFRRVRFEDGRTTDNNRAGAAFLNGGDVTVEGSLFLAARAADRGGHVHHDGGAVVIEDTSFADGHASNEGGCVHSTASLTVRRSVFERCGAPTGDQTNRGGAIHANAQLLVEDSLFEANRTDSWGGALWIRQDATVRGSVVCRNVTDGNSGAGIYVDAGDNRMVLVEDSLFLHNRTPSPGDWGSALRVEAGEDNDLTFQRNGFVGNAAAGAPILWTIVDDASALLFRDSSFYFNVALDGGVSAHEVTAGNDNPGRYQVQDVVGWPEIPRSHQFTASGLSLWNPGFTAPPLDTCDIGGVVPGGDLAALTPAQRGPFGVIVDADLDGVYTPEDCDDGDDLVYPGAPERCNDLDDDCDRAVDEGLPTSTFYLDADGDGQGDPAIPVEACDLRPHLVANDFDCDDGDPASFAVLEWPDVDQDGFGDQNSDPAGRCGGTPAPDVAPNALDCDDSDVDVSPDGTEVCDGIDNDCNGETDEGDIGPAWWPDGDEDGYGAGASVQRCVAPVGYVGASGQEDCDDTEEEVSPGQSERCDGADTDCNDVIDDGVGPQWWPDMDGDLVGSGTPVQACDEPADHVLVTGTADCDDAEPASYPGNVEICDDLDNDCNDVVDDVVTGVGTAWWPDVDDDGYGSGPVVEDCDAPNGYVEVDLDQEDCDDAEAQVNPVGVEGCDGLDNDCDGDVDEEGGSAWRIDADGDGVGAAGVVVACVAPPNGIPDSGGEPDCDDGDPTVGPHRPEVCDGVDNDCDGDVDEDGDVVDWYPDDDGDGYGDATGMPVEACAQPTGHVLVVGDCDDDDPAVNPDATDDGCDGQDVDCDGTPDDDAPWVPTWDDLDQDGHAGTPGADAQCVDAVEPTDCDDRDPTVNPAAAEVCDGVDNDCDDVIDPACDELPEVLGPPPATGCACDQGGPSGWSGWSRRR